MSLIVVYICIYHWVTMQGYRCRGGQRKRFKDMLKATTTACAIEPDDLETWCQTDYPGGNCTRRSSTTFNCGA